jgi:uncharacterized Fe-S center protein
MNITIYDLPKISLNKWYAGVHWTQRKKIKDAYKLLIKSEFKQVLTKDKCYAVTYHFGFKSRPLDASNTVAMIKMIEDVLFEDDTYKIVTELKITSRKADRDFVQIIVYPS